MYSYNDNLRTLHYVIQYILSLYILTTNTLDSELHMQFY